jgi:hypothetical protein
MAHTWTTERARLAALARHKTDPDDPSILDARRDLRAALLEARIREVVEAAPPLTDVQRRRLAAILHGGAADA